MRLMTDVLTLITRTISTDDYGNELATETGKTVYCEVDSITQTEFYAAANTEIQPDHKFTVFFGDYDGQVVIDYQDERYTVYRTYRAGDYMELYAERKIGGIPEAVANE